MLDVDQLLGHTVTGPVLIDRSHLSMLKLSIRRLALNFDVGYRAGEQYLSDSLTRLG